MNDFEPWIAESLARVYPLPAVTTDWDDVLNRVRARRKFWFGAFVPMTTRRRVVVALAFAVAIGAALLAGTPFSSRNGVLERAAAALTPHGRILHVVAKQVDDRTTLMEWWSLPSGSLAHVTSRDSSDPIGSNCVISESESETRCWNAEQNVIDVYPHPSPEPGFPKDEPQFRIDQPESLSRALASGYARLLGQTIFDGRRVIAVLLAAWTTHSPPPEFLSGYSHTVFLDPKTYLPVAELVPEGGATIYYQTFEFLPNTAENRKALDLPAPANAKVVVHPVGTGPPEGK